MKRCLAILALLLLAALPVFAEEALPTLSYGSTGEAVTALQERLTELGYYTFRITGNYQENSQKAVRQFQTEHGLEANGVADDGLQRLILSDAARPKPTPTPPPTPAPIDLNVAYPGKVEYGNSGDNVRRIQTRLAELGFYKLEISGNFMANTRTAVKDFQGHNALKVDGVVGQDTWQALFFYPDAVTADATPRPTPAPTPVPYRVGVDVTNQVTSVYGLDESGEYNVLVRQMICSTGTEKDPTPPGSYITNGATSRWCYFPKWGTHGQYWTRIDAYNAFHSVIYTEANTMALAKSSYTGLGKRASHGCIRLMLEDAKWIYDNIGKGTEIVVYEGELDEELNKSFKIPPLDTSVMLPAPTPLPTEQPAYRQDSPPPLALETLEYGAESELVYWLQRRLTDLGFYKGSITGGYYTGTQDAVKAFQEANGLKADGKADDATQTALYAIVIATPTPVPTPEPTPSPTPQPTQEYTVFKTPGPSSAPVPNAPPQDVPEFYVPRNQR